VKVLVTGASGAIGPHLVARLIGEGHEVRALVRPSSDLSALRPLDIELVRGDLTDPSSLLGATRGCQAVYHLARAKARSTRHRSSYLRVNAEGTANVMRAALEHGVERVVHVSSTAVYGRGRARGIDETSPPRPNSLHGRSKLAGERVVLEQVRRHGLPADIVRLPYVLGPGQRSFLRMCRQIRRGRLLMIGSGEVPCRVLDVEDAVEAFLLCGARRGPPGECFDIVGAEELTLLDLMGLIARELGVALAPRSLPRAPFLLAAGVARGLLLPFGFETRLEHGVAFFTREQGFDGSKARRELGWVPRVPARQALQRMLAWYVEAGLLEGS